VTNERTDFPTHAKKDSTKTPDIVTGKNNVLFDKKKKVMHLNLQQQDLTPSNQLPPHAQDPSYQPNIPRSKAQQDLPNSNTQDPTHKSA
jgi:hypothetical protein